MFPAFSIIQHDKQMVREAYITANRYIAAVTFPLMTWVLVTAPQLVRVVFGPKWVGAIVLIQILAFTSIEQSIGTNIGWIYLSQGRTDVLFKWGIFSTSVVLISFAAGLRWGVEGVALAYTIANYLLAYPSFAIPFRLIDLKVRHFSAQFQSIILATLTLGIIASLIILFLEKIGVTQDLTILAIATSASLLSYVVAIFVLDRELFTESVSLLGQLGSTDRE
jgi:PST family polysaccharide transporter